MSNSTNVFSKIYPEWVSFGEEQDYPDSFWEIIDFYLLHSLCRKQNYKRRTLQDTYLWKKYPWTPGDYLKDRLVNAIWSDGVSRIYMAQKRSELQRVIDDKDLDEDFYLNTSIQRMGFVKVSDKEYSSEFMSLLYHIRNCLAHGRYGIVHIPDDDYMLVMEDGDRKTNWFEVSGRFVIKASSLLAIKTIITDGPERDPDYSEEIIESIKRGNARKNSIIKDIGITETIWEREILKLRVNGRLCYEKKNWIVVEKLPES